jgi:molybdopterin converting factor small subunit
MTTIRIPPVLRPAISGAKQVEADGATLGAVLDDLFARYPGVREQIVTAEGDLSRFVNVFLNDQDIRFLDGLNTPVRGADTIVLLPAMAGGNLALPTSLALWKRGRG